VEGYLLMLPVTWPLRPPEKRLIDVLGQSDPLIKDALMTIIDRRDFIEPSPTHEKEPGADNSNKVISSVGFRTQIENDPAIVADLIRRSQTSVVALTHAIQTKSEPDVLDCILKDIGQLRNILSDPQNLGVILAAMDASSWINERMKEWLGEEKVADTLSQSVPDNITSEMGLALLRVADAMRPYPEVIAFLQQVKDDQYLEELEQFHGGQEARDAIQGYLDKYGMRCVGEIDITKPRWSEKPSMLVPMILGNVKKFEPGAGKRKFEQGRREALKKEQELLERLKSLPDGEQKAGETKRMIGLIRNFSGYREYPKYGIVSRYFVYKQAIVGLPVSSGVAEGRARVILNLEAADLEEGDILVTAFTDPSWTPLFLSLQGLVTEVGGLMTHGAVIAREYGLPAVVGVEHATRLIRDGQRIRVNGTEGYVEML
jgi:rifampicin phosphotransferase